MTPPPSRRPRRTTRPERTGAPRGRRSARTGPPTAGPGRRLRAAAAAPAPVAPTASRFASSKLARQIAVLGIVLSVIALSLAYPLRNYLGQRADLAAAVSQQHDLEQRIAELQIQQAALTDPDYITAEAKRRLQYVRPGDTVYVVQAPDLTPAEEADTATDEERGPWYSTLWDTLASDSGPAVDPSVLSPAPAPATIGPAPATIGPEPTAPATDPSGVPSTTG